jgi:hypothetical protein
LTNPSEASFRTHLTELAFRRHLSRLYDDPEPGNTNIPDATNNDSIDIGGLYVAAGKRQEPSPTKHPSAVTLLTSTLNLQSDLHLPSSSISNLNQSDRFAIPKLSSSASFTLESGFADTGSGKSLTRSLASEQGFHFANRATIGLRTPSHVFRSLGICTIAAIPDVSDVLHAGSNASVDGTSTLVLPLSTSSGPGHFKTDTVETGDGDQCAEDDNEVTLAGKWFIGAFGKWWLCGTLQLRQQAVINPSWAQSNEGVLSATSTKSRGRFTAGVLSFRALDLDPITEGG